jgi:hypothetical protein
MNNQVECLACDGILEPLPPIHPEYNTARITYDGTRRWFLCPGCQAVCIKDKQTGGWYLSAKTYTRLVEAGTIKDRLEE